MSYRLETTLPARARTRRAGLGDASQLCRSWTGNQPCAPDPTVPSDWKFQPTPLADGTFLPTYIDSTGASWRYLGMPNAPGGSGYVGTAIANGDRMFYASSGIAYSTRAGLPPLVGGVVGEPGTPNTAPGMSPSQLLAAGFTSQQLQSAGITSPTPATSTTATSNVVSAPLPTTPTSQQTAPAAIPAPALPAGFSLSALPWWVWLAAAGAAYALTR